MRNFNTELEILSQMQMIKHKMCFIKKVAKRIKNASDGLINRFAREKKRIISEYVERFIEIT
jgi:hypothetical protein